MALRETNLPEVDLGCIPMLSRVRSQPGEREGSRKRSGRATALANSSIVSRQEARGETMRKGSWWGRGIVCFLVAAATVLAGAGSESAAEVIPRPNFLILVSDDQRAETMGFMPRTEQRIFEEGIAFANAFATTPLCCPSRASLLTGMYAHRHGVRTNNISLTLPTVFDRLHDAGYFTGLVGKYLNSWDGTPRPEFDFWVSFPGAGAAYVSDKPFWLRFHLPLTPFEVWQVDRDRRNQLRCVASLDRAVESLVLDLERRGLLDSTVVLYLSDNSVFWGEHRLVNKAKVYEEAVRIPFAVRFPPLATVPRVETGLVAIIDIAPTMYDLAGIPIPSDVSGRSLVPLLTSSGPWREDLMLEGWTGPSFSAVRTGTRVYVENRVDLPELYDLTADPYQLRNQVFNRSYATEIAALQTRLRALRGE